MLATAQILFAAALTSVPAAATPNVQLAGRPTTFDYYKAAQPTSGWIETVIHKLDRRNGMLTVLNGSSERRTMLTFPVEDRTDVLEHRVGDSIKIQVFQDTGGIRVRHRDRDR